MGTQEFKTREKLQRILPERPLLPKDILGECKPGSPAVLISFFAPKILCEQLKRVLRTTDIVMERNGIITIYASVREKEDIETVSEKIENVLATCHLQPTLSITYLDI